MLFPYLLSFIDKNFLLIIHDLKEILENCPGLFIIFIDENAKIHITYNYKIIT